MPYTLTKIWTAKWYKRPWLLLLGKPTRSIDVYHDVEITSIDISVDADGLITSRVDFKGGVSE